MTYDEFNGYCGALPATNHVVQWGGAHVWKVGDKVFAIGGWADGEPAFTFKTSDISYEMLKQRPGLRPAPYLSLSRHEMDPASCRSQGSRTKN